MIYTQGGFTAGMVSSEPVPAGKVTLAMDFKYDGGGMGKGGTLTLLVNGKTVGEGRVEKTTSYKYALAEGQSIGEDTGSPVDFRREVTVIPQVYSPP